jgi:hypothetical protein
MVGVRNLLPSFKYLGTSRRSAMGVLRQGYDESTSDR